MADATLQLQKAVIAALKADGAVSALVAARVYHNQPPQKVTYPYLQAYPVAGGVYDGQALAGWEVVFRVVAWSRRKRSAIKQAGDIAAAVFAALHGAPLSLTSSAFVNGRQLEGSQRTLIGSDGETCWVTADYRFVTQD